MKDFVWSSHGGTGQRVNLPVRADEFYDEERCGPYIELLESIKRGNPVNPIDLPKRYSAQPGMARPKMLDLNVAGEWIVSEAVADVFRKFDLGQGGLFPVEICESDRKTAIDTRHFHLVFGNQKQCIDPERSKLRRSMIANQFSFPGYEEKGAVVVTEVALKGPDIWVDPQIYSSVFFSRALGEALQAEKLHKLFMLMKCVVSPG